MGLWKNLTGTLASGMVGLVSIFLVIGGVVIMNVMLASVTERTREIGIRKSLGAKRRDMLLQFLVESTVMSVVGRRHWRLHCLGPGDGRARRHAGADVRPVLRGGDCRLDFVRGGRLLRSLSRKQGRAAGPD